MKERERNDLGWFAANLLFKSIDASTDRPYLFEERIVLLRSSSEDEARERAEKIGNEEQTEYKNTDGNLVRVIFVKIQDLKSLIDDEIGDGSEIYYRYIDR